MKSHGRSSQSSTTSPMHGYRSTSQPLLDQPKPQYVWLKARGCLRYRDSYVEKSWMSEWRSRSRLHHHHNTSTSPRIRRASNSTANRGRRQARGRHRERRHPALPVADLPNDSPGGDDRYLPAILTQDTVGQVPGEPLYYLGLYPP